MIYLCFFSFIHPIKRWTMNIFHRSIPFNWLKLHFFVQTIANKLIFTQIKNLYFSCTKNETLRKLFSKGKPELIVIVFLFVGYDEDAEFVNFGKKRFLFHDTHRYYKNRAIGSVVHWRCVGYHRNNCRARATTKVINGRERVRINCKDHTHYSESFYFSGTAPGKPF